MVNSYASVNFSEKKNIEFSPQTGFRVQGAPQKLLCCSWSAPGVLLGRSWLLLLLLFMAAVPNISLWPNATTFERSPRGNSPKVGAPVWCSQRPQHLRSHIEAIHDQRSLQFIVAKGHNSSHEQQQQQQPRASSRGR